MRGVGLGVLCVVIASCSSSESDSTDAATESVDSAEPTDTSISTSTGDTGTEPELDAVDLDGITAAIHSNMGSVVVVDWNQNRAADTWVEYSFDEDVWLHSPVVASSAGPVQELLLGVPFGTEVTFRIGNDVGGGPLTSEESSIHTDDLPSGVPQCDVVYSDPDQTDSSTPWILGVLDADTNDWHPWTFIMDRQGRVVWAYKTPGSMYWSMHPQPSFDGTSLLIDLNSYWGAFDGGANSQIQRMKIDGSIVETMSTPGLHHAFAELADGTLAWGAAQGMSNMEETLDLRHPNGTLETIWSCRDWLTAIGGNGGCGSNTLRFDALTNTFLYSFYTVETVVEIDASTGEANRWFGHAEGAYAFDPPESAFYWQHGGYYTETGTFMTSSENVGAQETVVREYEVDAANQALVEVWNFGIGAGVYGKTMGEAYRLPGGNVLHNYGAEARLREATADGEVVWEVFWPHADDEIGRTTPLEDLYLFKP